MTVLGRFVVNGGSTSYLTRPAIYNNFRGRVQTRPERATTFYCRLLAYFGVAGYDQRQRAFGFVARGVAGPFIAVCAVCVVYVVRFAAF